MDCYVKGASYEKIKSSLVILFFEMREYHLVEDINSEEFDHEVARSRSSYGNISIHSEVNLILLNYFASLFLCVFASLRDFLS